MAAQAGAARPKPVVFVIGLLIAAALGYGAFSLWQDHARIAATGIAVEGRMTGRIREVQSTGRGHATTYYPVVSFRTQSGNVIVASTADSVDRDTVVSGRTVQLRYDPADPSIVYLADSVAAGAGATPWVLAGLGAVVAALSLWGLLVGGPLRLPF